MKKSLLLLLSTWLSINAYLGGCANVTPDVVLAEHADASSSTDGPLQQESFSTECLKCLNAPDTPGPGCQTEWTACQASPKCNALIHCFLNMGCNKVSTKSQGLECAQPCEVGLSAESLALPKISSLDLCLAHTCRLCVTYYNNTPAP